jgi:hypothetical protein
VQSNDAGTIRYSQLAVANDLEGVLFPARARQLHRIIRGVGGATVNWDDEVYGVR